MATALAVVGLAASACTGTATVTQTGASPGASTPEPAAAPSEGPAPENTLADVAEPTAEPTVEPAASPTSTEVPAAEPEVPAEPLPPAEFRPDALVGLSPAGTHAYAGTTVAWDEPTPCDAVAAESLAVVEIRAGVEGRVAGAAAGLEQAGDVRQFLPGPGATAAILSSCGPIDGGELWLNQIELGPDGRIVAIGDRLDIGGPNERDPYLMQWIDDDTIEARILIEVDPENSETWLIEHRQISMSSGQTTNGEQFALFDDDQLFTGTVLTTSEGFTYRSIQDPESNIGCEGFGVASTLEVDDGTERRLALTQPNLVFSDVSNLHMAATGHIAWTSSCEGFVSAYVGKVLADGRIADAHLIETYSFAGSESADYSFYRLTDDGFLAAVGRTFAAADSVPAFLSYDLNSDPHFINTAEPAPQIDAEPLFAAVNGDGTWHVGDTLSLDPACGGRTLYGQTAGGFVRAFAIGQELDEIVGVNFGETRTLTYDFGDDFVSRTVVLETECAESYDGRRVWFATEFNGIIWGLSVQQADLGEVARVVAVRDELQDGTQFIERSIVEVELLDGSLAEVELVGLPFDG